MDVTGAELEQARVALAQGWSARLANLLEEDPEAEADLRALVGQIQARLVSAEDHAVAIGRDMNINASGGVAAGAVHASAIAGQGGTAIGRMEYQRPEAARQPVSLALRPVYLEGREGLLAELDARLLTGEGTWPRIVALCGLAGAARPASRWSTHIVMWPGQGWRGNFRPRTRLSFRRSSAGWPPCSAPWTRLCRGPGGVGACAASGLPRAVAAGVR